MNIHDLREIEEIKNRNKPVLIYGNANHARIILNSLIKNDIRPQAFVVDDYAFSDGQTIEGFPVLPISRFYKDISDYSIVIGFCNIDRTKAILSLNNLLKTDFHLLWEPDNELIWTNEYIDNVLLSESVIGQFADERSQKILKGLISARRDGDINSIIELAEPVQYFTELTYEKYSANEIFVDCGAFNGDTIVQYRNFTGNNYKRIYAFEPMEDNLSLLYGRTKDVDRLTVINRGTWNKEDVLTFSNNTSASQIDENGTVEVPVDSIDHVVGDDKVTFIKMDIEGSEYEALLGAKNTIEKNMPKLAICVYHKYDDIPKLLNCIKSMENGNKKYNYYLRHYSNSAYETVMYAIPDKK